MHDPLEPVTRELVGIAAAIAGHCQPCFVYHYARALELGVSGEAIRAAMHLAKAVRASGNRHMDEFAALQLPPDPPGTADDPGRCVPSL